MRLPAGSLNNPLTVLKNLNYRYYFIGIAISWTGSWISNTALPWLTYSITGSPILLSITAALQLFPTLLSLFAGVIIDRFSKKKLILAVQFTSFVFSLVLAILTLTGHVRYWHLVILAILRGLAAVFDTPARQSFVVDLVGKDNLMNASSLNSSLHQTLRIIGPAAAGFLMLYINVGFCFLFDAVSYAAFMMLILLIQIPEPKKNNKPGQNVLFDAKAALEFIFKSQTLRIGIISSVLVGIFAMNFPVLLPVLAKEVFHLKENGFGMMMSFMGAGSLAAAVVVGLTNKSKPRPFNLFIAPLLLAVLLVLAGLSHQLPIILFYLVLTGFFTVLFTITNNTTMQLYANDSNRGRILSIYAMASSGATPLGNLLSGYFTEKFGVGIAFVVCGGFLLILFGILEGVLFWNKRYHGLPDIY